jgi:hypothetical protein
MNLQEKAFYQQIHPLKLATDIGVTAPSLYLLWRHRLLAGTLVAFIPAVVASSAVVLTADLEKQRQSAFGRYIGRYMTGPMMALRFAGFLVSALGVWYRLWWLVPAGFLITLAGWFRGLLLPNSGRRDIRT